MFTETEVPVEGEAFTVPVRATATGKIVMWYHRPEETLGGEPIVLEAEVSTLCAIDAKVNGFPKTEFVKAPITGILVKIIKEKDEFVKKGDTIAEMKPPHVNVVPPWILDELGPGEVIV